MNREFNNSLDPFLVVSKILLARFAKLCATNPYPALNAINYSASPVFPPVLSLNPIALIVGAIIKNNN